ncbi:hypothetical protein ACVW0P_002577 [Mucilaginibacter sp. UYNi724]
MAAFFRSDDMALPLVLVLIAGFVMVLFLQGVGKYLLVHPKSFAVIFILSAIGLFFSSRRQFKGLLNITYALSLFLLPLLLITVTVIATAVDNKGELNLSVYSSVMQNRNLLINSLIILLVFYPWYAMTSLYRFSILPDK